MVTLNRSDNDEGLRLGGYEVVARAAVPEFNDFEIPLIIAPLINFSRSGVIKSVTRSGA